jgi:transcription initiation factor IIE alpha subunit
VAVSKSITNTDDPINLREAEVCLALDRGKTTTVEIAKLTGYTQRTIQRALAAMRNRAIVERSIRWDHTGKSVIWYALNWASFRGRVCRAAKRIVAERRGVADTVSDTRARRRQQRSKCGKPLEIQTL